MTQEKITRINELYHKSKAEGLTEEEKKEQAQLRQEYIAAIKGAIAGQMQQVDVQQENGEFVNAAKIREEKMRNKNE